MITLLIRLPPFHHRGDRLDKRVIFSSSYGDEIADNFGHTQAFSRINLITFERDGR